MSFKSYKDSPVLPFADAKAFHDWLEKNYSISTGIWIQFYRKDSGTPSVTYKQALDEALCYGWIDGPIKKLEAPDWWIHKFSPRRPQSIWSVNNQRHVERLIGEGRMTAAGQRAVDMAKADGRWEKAYASPSSFTLPEDFKQILSRNKKAQAFYDSLSKANQYAIYFRIHTAKRQETKERWIKKIMQMLLEKKTFH